MTTISKALKSIKTLVMSTAIVLTMVQCSEDEIVADATLAEDATTQMTAESAEVGSLSVSGLYTEIQGDVPCASCTYLVDPKETSVDGQELGFKPGSIICLRKALKYSSVDFVNMEGTEENPIIIGYCAE
jgi:hypothetical protein